MSTAPFDLPIQQQEKKGGRSQYQPTATDPTTSPSLPSHLSNNHSNYSNNSRTGQNLDSSPFTTSTGAFHSPYGGLKQVSSPNEQGQQPFSGFASYSSPSVQQSSSSWTPPPPVQQQSSYHPSPNNNPNNYHPYQQQPPVIQLKPDNHKPTTRAYPWTVHTPASSSISVSDLPNTGPTPTATSHFHPRHYSERRKLIHSFQSSVDTSSRPQTPVAMESRPPFLSNNGNSQDNKDNSRSTGTRSPRRSLETLSGSRPASPGLNKTAKKPFWMSFPRRFRPKGAIRPKKSDSVGNKKAKFSNERTLVHWIKAAMLLGSLSMTLLSFGQNQVTPYIGAVLITICCMTLTYSVTTFQVRMEWLQMRRDDVIYYDRLAPTFITILLMLTFGFNAVVTFTGEFTSNKDYLKKKGFDT